MKPFFIDKFVNWIVSNPWKSLLVGLIFIATTLPGFKMLEPDFSYRIWFRIGDPLLQRFDQFERRFGSDETATLVMYSPSGIFDMESVELLREVTADLWLVPEIIRVDSLSTYRWVHSQGDDIEVESLIPDLGPLTPEILAERKQVALNHEVVPDYLISRDGKTALLFATLKPAIGGTPDFDVVVNGVRKVVAKYEGRGDHQFYITGSTAINQAFKESTQGDMQKLMPLVVGIIAFVLLVLFRRPGGVLLPILITLLTVIMTLGTAGYYGIKMNNMTAMVPQYLIAVGIADSVHILALFYRRLRSGMNKTEAVIYSLRHNFLPTILTSLSTGIGFFSFATAPILPVAHLGILTATGTLYAWVITYLFLAPLIVIFPTMGVKKTIEYTENDTTKFAEKSAQLVFNWRKPIFWGTLVLVFVCFAIGTRNVVNSDPFKYFSKEFFLTVATDFMEEHVGGVMIMETVIDSGVAEGVKDPVFLNKVEKYQEWINERPYVVKTISILDVLKQTNRSLHGDDQAFYKLPQDRETLAQQLLLYTLSLPQGMDVNDRISLNYDALRLSVKHDVHDSKTFMAIKEEFEIKGKEFGLDVSVTGKSPLYMGMNTYVVESFLVSAGIAISLISLLLILVFRSIKIGLLAMVPNLIPLIIGGAYLKLLGIYLDVGTVLVTSVSLGIAVDDTIHFITTYRRYTAEGLDPIKATAKIFSNTGPALIVTTIILACGYGVLYFGDFMPNKNFGVMVASVLTTALIVDMIFLPAMLMIGNISFNDKKESETLVLL